MVTAATAPPPTIVLPKRPDPLMRVGRLLQVLLPTLLLTMRIWQITERFQIRQIVAQARELIGKGRVTT